ncbi:hypothetical protein MD537_00750 [Flavihumibacter sediminis]|nr:hypothetical protein [Flavihumibacter sediminis]
MKKVLIWSILFFATLICKAQYWTAPKGIREIPISTLNDIAVASFDYQGPVIYFNPIVVQQVGPLVSSFFQAHEYGHHYLGHVTAKLFNPNNPYVQVWLSLNAENAADSYAVQYHVQLGNKAVLQAAYNRFIYFPNNGDATHPPSVYRAQNIANLYYQFTGYTLFP